MVEKKIVTNYFKWLFFSGHKAIDLGCGMDPLKSSISFVVYFLLPLWLHVVKQETPRLGRFRFIT